MRDKKAGEKKRNRSRRRCCLGFPNPKGGADKAAEPEISFLEIGVPLITFCNRIGMTTKKMLGFPLRTNFISGCWSGFSRDKRWVLAGASSSDKKTPAPPMS